MPFAVGLDQIGTDNPIYDSESVAIAGDYIEISWDDYIAAINLLIAGRHVNVVDGVFILDSHPPEPTSD
jgi:hypothetical protein